MSGFLAVELAVFFRQSKLSYFLPKQALVKVPNENSGYLPDALVVDRNALKDEPLWEKYSTLTKGESIPLVIEIVSSNWRDDYLTKLRDYFRVASRREEIGINEYWIVDYLGIGGYRYLGNPKQPTISIYQLIDDEYQVQCFRGNELIKPTTFPGLDLTANQIFQG
ncbi:Uma2 family endonuclease [Okeania sp. SIO2B3]|uniref:Uma2 family endonuclease n=1 Tax=Okeania sp. SIO2B3 TaxID=2607784 RepID=UPI003414660F